ncbi:MAG: hypothetical protein MJY87_02470 [Fibrobacter sp.]|nr:hypothetical protein [Fibrobacter sp.]
MHFVGYHGTSRENAKDIESKSFEFPEDSGFDDNDPSNSLYLGRGAYFFKSGISNPYEDAKNFAEIVKKIKDPSVIRADIDVDDDKILNLNDLESILVFNTFKKKVVETRKKDKRIGQGHCDDGTIVNLMVLKANLDYSAAIIQRNICMDPVEKDLKFKSMVPNCIVLCVKDKKCVSNERITDKMEDENDI